MADTVSSIFAGADSLWIGQLNSLGVFTGIAGIDTVNTFSGFGRAKGVRTSPFPVTEPNRVGIEADDTRLGTFQFGNSGDASGIIEMGVQDVDIEALAQGSLVYTLGEWAIGILGISNPTFATLAVLTHQQAKSQDSANYGEAGFMNYLAPNVQLSPLGPESAAFQAAGSSRYSMILNRFIRIPFGPELDNSNFDVSDGLTMKWWSKYRSMLHSGIGNATWTTVVVDYTPRDSVPNIKAFAITALGVVTALTVSSVTPATKTITLSAAPASGSFVVVIYEAVSLS